MNLKKFMEQNNLTQSRVGRSIGMSTSVINMYLKGTYTGNNKSLEEKLQDFMANYKLRDLTENEINVIKLKNLESTHYIIEEAIIDREMAMIFGASGSGKTVAIKAFVAKNPTAILIESSGSVRLLELLKELCEKLKVIPSSSSDKMIKDISEVLKKREAVLIFDEAESFTTSILEAIRRIWDFSKVPTVLVGTYALITNLKGRNGKLLQLHRRFTGRWEFLSISDKEWEKLFGNIYPEITALTTNLGIASNIFKKATRYAKRKNEKLNPSHIALASKMMILD